MVQTAQSQRLTSFNFYPFFVSEIWKRSYEESEQIETVEILKSDYFNMLVIKNNNFDRSEINFF